MQNKVLLFALLLLGVTAFYFAATSERAISPDADNQSDLLTTVAEAPGRLDSSLPSISDRSIDFYRQLSPGAALQFKLDNQGTVTIADIAISDVTAVSGVITIRGSVDAGGDLLMTVGEQFVHLFLSYAGGIYEYSGRDFQGVLKRTTDMRFDNDIARLPDQSMPVYSQPDRKPAVADFSIESADNGESVGELKK